MVRSGLQRTIRLTAHPVRPPFAAIRWRRAQHGGSARASGTNQRYGCCHGDHQWRRDELYPQIRDEQIPRLAVRLWTQRVLDANSWTNNLTGAPRTKARAWDYGASVGGPIRKDKLFFFGAFERYTQTDFGLGGFSPSTTVPRQKCSLAISANRWALPNAPIRQPAIWGIVALRRAHQGNVFQCGDRSEQSRRDGSIAERNDFRSGTRAIRRDNANSLPAM